MSFLYPPKVFLLIIFAADSSSVIPARKNTVSADNLSAIFIFRRQNGAQWLKN
jgi:hypothetical protein